MLGFNYFNQKSIHRTYAHIWARAYMCAVRAPTVGTGAPLFKVSPWALKLWQRRDPPPDHHHHHHHPLFSAPSQLQNITRASLGSSRGGNVIWKRGANPAQQQLLPNHNNLGKGCGLYFMGGEGPRMFIYLSPQSALMRACACVSVRVCLSVCDRILLTFNLCGEQNPKVTKSRLLRLTPQPVLWAPWWICKNNLFHLSKHNNEFWIARLPFTFLPACFHCCHFSAGIITLRAISYFKYANTDTTSLQTVYVRTYVRGGGEGERGRVGCGGAAFLKCPASAYFFFSQYEKSLRVRLISRARRDLN